LSRTIQTLLLILASATVCSAQTPPLLINGAPISQASSEDIYRSACAGCHAIDGRGNPAAVIGFDTELPDFTDCSFASPEAAADWVAVVTNGGPVRAFDRKMPAFGDLLSLDQITRVVDYVRGLCSDKSWPRGELNLPRALVTEKAFPENEAVVTTSLSRDPGSMSNEFLYEHRIGSRSQYEIVVPFNLQDRDASAGWNRGLGDIKVALKRVMFHSFRRGTILSLGTELALPTGKETLGLGGGRTVIEPFVAFGQILRRDAFVQFQAGVERPITRQEATTEGFWRTAIGKTFTEGWGRAWSPMIELLGAREFESAARSEWDLVPQLQVTLSTRQHVILNAGFRFPVNNRGERNKALMVYLLWDWFDGGLFSGW
jgi:hypothetical protein